MVLLWVMDLLMMARLNKQVLVVVAIQLNHNFILWGLLLLSHQFDELCRVVLVLILLWLLNDEDLSLLTTFLTDWCLQYMTI